MLAASFFCGFSNVGAVLGSVEPDVKAVFVNSNAFSDMQDPKWRVVIDEFIRCCTADIENAADVFDCVRGIGIVVHGDSLPCFL